MQDELSVKPAGSEHEQTHRVTLLEGINLVQTAAQAWETMGLYAECVKGWASFRFNTLLLFSWQGCRPREPLYMMLQPYTLCANLCSTYALFT